MRRPARLLIAAGVALAAAGVLALRGLLALEPAGDLRACLPPDVDLVLQVRPALSAESALARRLLDLPPLRASGALAAALAGEVRAGARVAIGLRDEEWVVLAPLGRTAGWAWSLFPSSLKSRVPAGVEVARECGIAVAGSTAELVRAARARIAARSGAEERSRDPRAPADLELWVRAGFARELLFLALGAGNLRARPHLDALLQEIGDLRLHGDLGDESLELEGLPPGLSLGLPALLERARAAAARGGRGQRIFAGALALDAALAREVFSTWVPGLPPAQQFGDALGLVVCAPPAPTAGEPASLDLLLLLSQARGGVDLLVGSHPQVVRAAQRGRAGASPPAPSPAWRGTLDLAALRSWLRSGARAEALAELRARRPLWERELRIRHGLRPGAAPLTSAALEKALQRRLDEALPAALARREALIDAWLRGWDSIELFAGADRSRLGLRLAVTRSAGDS